MTAKTMKKWTKEEIAHHIETDNKWLLRSLLAIYRNQTIDEQKSELTSHDNGIGFNGVDAPFLSNAAKFYMDKGFLTLKHMQAVRKRMKKYAGQLSRIANGLI